MPAPPVWVTGQVLTASDVNLWLAPRAQIKSADTTRTATTTLVDDPDLAALAVEANSRYQLIVVMEVESPAAADIKLNLTGPAGFAFRGNIYNGAVNASVNWNSGSTVPPATSGGTGGNNDRMFASGWLTTAGTAGSITLQWAQQVSDAGNTVLKAGTHWILTRLA